MEVVGSSPRSSGVPRSGSVLVPRGLEPICEWAVAEVESLRSTEFAPNLRTADRFAELAAEKGCAIEVHDGFSGA